MYALMFACAQAIFRLMFGADDLPLNVRVCEVVQMVRVVQINQVVDFLTAHRHFGTNLMKTVYECMLYENLIVLSSHLGHIDHLLQKIYTII